MLFCVVAYSKTLATTAADVVVRSYTHCWRQRNSHRNILFMLRLTVVVGVVVVAVVATDSFLLVVLHIFEQFGSMNSRVKQIVMKNKIEKTIYEPTTTKSLLLKLIHIHLLGLGRSLAIGFCY